MIFINLAIHQIHKNTNYFIGHSENIKLSQNMTIPTICLIFTGIVSVSHPDCRILLADTFTNIILKLNSTFITLIFVRGD